jgi:hypothetical protein
MKTATARCINLHTWQATVEDVPKVQNVGGRPRVRKERELTPGRCPKCDGVALSFTMKGKA